MKVTIRNEKSITFGHLRVNDYFLLKSSDVFVYKKIDEIIVNQANGITAKYNTIITNAKGGGCMDWWSTHTEVIPVNIVEVIVEKK